MGSSSSQQLCCAVCERCGAQEREAESAESSETKPILQPSGFPEALPPSPALEVPQQRCRAPAEAPEENGQPCPAAEPAGPAPEWEAAWNPMDFFVEAGGEIKDLTQADKQQVGKTEEEIKSVPGVPGAQPVGDTALGAERRAEEGEPGSEGALCAGITLQERNILSLIEISSETEPCPGCEAEPPARSRDVLPGRDLSLCAVQVAQDTQHVQGTARAHAAERSPQSAQRAELTCLVGTATLLSVQNPSGGRARRVAELYSTSAVSWESLCPEWGSLEPPAQVLGSLKHELQCALSAAQGTGSLGWAEPAEDGAKCEVGEERSRECEPETVAGEAEPQQQTAELPEEPAASVPIPAQQEAAFPNVPPSLSEALGSSGETEAENAEARDV